MVTRRRWGVRCWRAVGPAALLLSLVVPQVGPARAISVQAAAPVVVRPELSTYAGAPAVGTPTEVAQQPFGLAVLDRYTFVADPTNHLVRLLIDNTEVAFAGLGSPAVDGDGGNPAAAQLAGPYAAAIGRSPSRCRKCLWVRSARPRSLGGLLRIDNPARSPTQPAA